MGWSSISSSATTQTGIYQSCVVSAVNLNYSLDIGIIYTSAVTTTAIRDGQAFSIVRGSNIVGVRCAQQISGTNIYYYRLYQDSGTEIPTDIQVNDTIKFYETTTEVATSTSALGSISGVGLTTLGTAERTYRIYAMGNNRQVVNGLFQIFNTDFIWFDLLAADTSITIGAGGGLVVGMYKTRGGASNYSKGINIRGTKASANGTIPILSVSTSTSRFDWFGGVVEAGGGINDVASAVTNVYSKVCVFRSIGTTGYGVRCTSTSFKTYGLTLDNANAIVYIGAADLGGLQAMQCDTFLNLSSSTPSNTFMTNKGGILVGGNNVDVAFWSSKWFRIINQATGSALTVGGNSLGTNTQNIGLHEYRQEVSISVIDTLNNPINNLRYFCRDTNNGIRLSASQIGTNPNYLVDNIYEGITTSGTASITTSGGVLLAVAYQKGATQARFENVYWDRRGLSNDSSDKFKFLFACYGYVPDYTIATLKGIVPAQVSKTLLVDTNITNNIATVSAYSQIINLDNLYDYGSYWLSSNGLNMETIGAGKYLITCNGSSLDLGSRNLIISSAAQSTLSLSGNNITIASNMLDVGTKFKTLTTTGTITFSGANFTGNYVDSTGTYVTITIAGLINGSRVQVYNTTDSIEIDNFIYNTSYKKILNYIGDKTIRVRATYCSGLSAKLRTEAVGILTSNGTSFLMSQTDDSDYMTNGIDGSTVTEFSADYPNIQIDINDPDGVTSIKRLYAWFKYNMSTSAGISNYYGGMDAVDSANYIIHSSILNIQLDNISTMPVKIVGGYLSRDDGNTVIASTSNSIQMDPGKAYIANSSSVTVPLSRIESNVSLIPALL